jgi:hypothetical protein
VAVATGQLAPKARHAVDFPIFECNSLPIRLPEFCPLKPILRFAAYLVLAAGVLLAVVDATRSVALGALTMSRLGDLIDHPGAAVEMAAPQDNVIALLLQTPLAPLAALLFVAIYALASRRRAPRHF